MGKQFLTLSEVQNKIGSNFSGNTFATKQQIISTGKCDLTKLTDYGHNDFVIDDDIIEGDYYLVKSLTDKTKLENPLFEIIKGEDNGTPIFFNRSFSDIKKCESIINAINITAQKRNIEDGTFEYNTLNGILKIYPNQRQHKLYATNSMLAISSYMNITMPNDSIIRIQLRTISPEPTYSSDENVVRCYLKTARYGYYSGYGLTRIHLGDFDDDIQAMVMDKANATQINWNHHFGYTSNQHGYTSVTVWIDDELIINKRRLDRNTESWSVVYPTTEELQKWLAKCDNKEHKVHIKYFK